MAQGHIIPDATLPPKDPSGQPPPPAANDGAQASVTTQVLVAARDSILPIIYGGPERVAGLLYIARIYQNDLLLVQLLGEGPVEEIENLELNDEALTGGAWSANARTFTNGIYAKRYLGTASQTVDATLAAAIPGFSEAMPGTAYLVLRVPKGVSQGFPRITAEVKGLKVYDPRGPTTAWSDNPALILADFLSATYGARKSVDWASVGVAADYCDEVVGSSPNTEKRSLLTLALLEKRSTREWIEILRQYVPAWVVIEGDSVKILADQPRSSDHTFTAANIDSEPPPRLRKRGVRDCPNVVQIGYTRTDIKPWASHYAEAVSGSPAIRRIARIDMPGIRRYSQARRFAIERLNHYTLEDLEGEVAVFEDGLKVQVGDVVTVTDDIGLTAKAMRVLGVSDRGHGRWSLTLREYDAGAYSSVVESGPGTPDTGLPNPSVVAAPTALVIAETVYLEKNLAADSLARGLIYQSRFDVSWTASAHAYPITYRVQFLDGPTIIHEGQSAGLTYASPPVQQGKTYTVRVTAVNSLGFESPALEGSEVALGKLLPPGAVPSPISALEIGGEVLLSWQPAIDIDVVRYEWRYTPNETGAGSWEGAVFIDRVDGLRARFKGLFTGTHRFYVKAIDSVGNYSTNATTVDVTITTDADAFLQDREFTSPTLTNMIAWPMLEGVWKKRWATSVASDQWNSVMPDPVNSGGNPVITYRSSGESKFVGESWDLGVQVTGDWVLTPDVTVLSGSVIYEIEHSDNGSSWTTESGTSWKGSARYVRPVIRATGTDTLVLNAPPRISLAAITRSESGGPVTSSASGATTVTLINRYTKAVRITVTPLGTTARMPTVDNVVVTPSSTNSFDVYLFDATGTQVASDFRWDFEGF